MDKVNDAHQPVLLAETIAALAIKPNGIYVDATYGRGGHTQAILAGLGDTGRVLVIDKDPEAIAAAKLRFQHDSRIVIKQGSFTRLMEFVTEQGWLGQVEGLLLDLGVSSPQLDNPRRGFSFLHDGPLDMRMDPTMGIAAVTWLNTVKASELAPVLKDYGEERYAKRIAHAIVQARAVQPITTTRQLADIVAKANPAWEIHKHPATRTFQAIRIFINQELAELKLGLAQALQVLKIGGRLAVITFHSLEDRIVKRFMQAKAQGQFPQGLPVRAAQICVELKLVNRAVRPSSEEIGLNPRARSAILRVAEKLS